MRCCNAWYRSKECQNADWKTHKQICRKIIKLDRDSKNTLNTVLFNFLTQKYYSLIQKALNEKCSTISVESNELAVEADFMPNEDDIIPAFHDPPMLRIVLIREYLSGEEIPEWMRGKSDEI